MSTGSTPGSANPAGAAAGSATAPPRSMRSGADHAMCAVLAQNWWAVAARGVAAIISV